MTAADKGRSRWVRDGEKREHQRVRAIIEAHRRTARDIGCYEAACWLDDVMEAIDPINEGGELA